MSTQVVASSVQHVLAYACMLSALKPMQGYIVQPGAVSGNYFSTASL